MKHIPIKELPVVEPPKLAECGQIFLAAADYIEKHGWCQGVLCNDEGAVCLMGALDAVTRDAIATRYTATSFTNLNHTINVLFTKLGHNAGSIPRWNDNKKRTKEEVVSTLRKFAWEQASKTK